MRDRTQAREGMKGLVRTTKQRLNAFLLRYGCIYVDGNERWTQALFLWLENLKIDIPVQYIVFSENVDTIKQEEYFARKLPLIPVLPATPDKGFNVKN